MTKNIRVQIKSKECVTITKMDSYYPKFGEVEIVLVDDDNDFFDPLETNFDCEDENEDTKLQLNDAVYEDTQFELDEFDSRENSPSKENIESNELMEQMKFCENSHDNEPCDIEEHLVKVENIDDMDDMDDNSNGSSDDRQNSESFENNFSSDSFDNLLHKVKVDPDIILNTNAKTNPSNIASDEPDPKQDDCLMEKAVAKTKMKGKLRIKSKIKSKLKTKPTFKRECNTGASTSTSETDTTRHSRNKRRQYSRRNEIPKQAKHNEAYDKKLLFCKICSIQFDRSPAFTEHMRSSHSIDKPFECFICSKPYRICSLLAEHIR